MVPPLKTLIGLLLIVTTLHAQNPWAVSVETYVEGSAPASGGYTDPTAALGRPTVLTYADYTELEPSTVVVPVYPPWEPDEIVSIGEGGKLILEMGKPITNHPRNPYGVDFLVFGNALLSGGGLYDQTKNDPRTYTLSSSPSLESKWGEVAVSADGENWFYFPSEQRVGRLMPTLGKIWTGTEWGADADPTIPPDPTLTLANLADMNLADLCIRYRGGAGGTGFNLDDLIVPDGITLPDAFHYVKIFVQDDGDSLTNRRTEIDAVTVVSPVDGFTRWQQKHFEWTRDPADEAPTANVDGDAYINWEEYALGGDPNEADIDLPLPKLQVTPNGFSLHLPVSASEAPWKVWATQDLTHPDSWQIMLPQPNHLDVTEQDQILRTFTLQPENPGVQIYRVQLEGPP